jgi:hypothetical protein
MPTRLELLEASGATDAMPVALQVAQSELTF